MKKMTKKTVKRKNGRSKNEIKVKCIPRKLKLKREEKSIDNEILRKFKKDRKNIKKSIDGERPTEVQYLGIEGVLSEEISGLIDSMKSLESLSITNGALKTLKGFPELPELKSLRLTNNFISTGLDSLTLSKQLTYLDLSGNAISKLDQLEPLRACENLRHLDLFDCGIRGMKNFRKKIFNYLKKLQSLDGFDEKNDRVLEDSEDEDYISLEGELGSCQNPLEYNDLSILPEMSFMQKMEQLLSYSAFDAASIVQYGLSSASSVYAAASEFETILPSPSAKHLPNIPPTASASEIKKTRCKRRAIQKYALTKRKNDKPRKMKPKVAKISEGKKRSDLMYFFPNVCELRTNFEKYLCCLTQAKADLQRFSSQLPIKGDGFPVHGFFRKSDDLTQWEQSNFYYEVFMSKNEMYVYESDEDEDDDDDVTRFQKYISECFPRELSKELVLNIARERDKYMRLFRLNKEDLDSLENSELLKDSDEEKSLRLDLLGKKKDKKESKKDKGYKVFEGESSDEELDEARSPGKSKKIKSSFKFPGKDKKEKHNKAKDKDVKEKKEERVCKKEYKENKKDHRDSKKDSKDSEKVKVKKKKGSKLLRIKDKKKKNSSQEVIEKPIFGIPLPAAVERNKSHDGIDIPVIVRECIDYIEEHGLTCEGIYRISGLKSKLRKLKDQYNQGEKVYLYEHEPHIVASLLKRFLRDLPEPILTAELAPKFEEAAALKNNEKAVETLQKLLQELPNCNRLLLSWIIIHMLHVVSLQKRNKMDLQNIFIVLSPTLQISHNILQAFFAYANKLFSGIELKKYVPPIDLDSSRLSLELPDSPSTIAEELSKQENILNVLHAELNTGLRDHQKEEKLWEIQRIVTQLKRKLRFLRQVQATECPDTCELQPEINALTLSEETNSNIIDELSSTVQVSDSRTACLASEIPMEEIKGAIPSQTSSLLNEESNSGTYSSLHTEQVPENASVECKQDSEVSENNSNNNKNETVVNDINPPLTASADLNIEASENYKIPDKNGTTQEKICKHCRKLAKKCIKKSRIEGQKKKRKPIKEVKAHLVELVKELKGTILTNLQTWNYLVASSALQHKKQVLETDMFRNANELLTFSWNEISHQTNEVNEKALSREMLAKYSVFKKQRDELKKMQFWWNEKNELDKRVLKEVYEMLNINRN